jgi:hypothetical protein
LRREIEESYNPEKMEENNIIYQIGNKCFKLGMETEKYIQIQRDTLSHTSNWPSDFEDAIVHTTLKKIKDDYKELFDNAKNGDIEDAIRLVHKVIKEERIKRLAEKYPNAIVCFPYKNGNGKENQIPVAFAQVFEDFGLRVGNIICVTNPHHRGADDLSRLIIRTRYEGEVEKGKDYIIIDDQISSGATLRDLKDYICNNGGKLRAITALTASFGGTRIIPEREAIELINKNGITNEQLKKLGITDNIYGITNAEARRIIRLTKSERKGETLQVTGDFITKDSRIQKGEDSGKDKFISIFKMRDGTYGINIMRHGVRSTTHRLSQEDTEKYFEGLKGQPKEEVDKRREGLAKKYFADVKALPVVSPEAKERITEASVFKMQDGKSYGVRCKIDGEQQSAKRINQALVLSYFNQIRILSKEELQDRRIVIAAECFKEELNAPKQEQNQGMKR